MPHVHGPSCTHDHAPGSLGEHRPRTDAICIERVSYAYPGARGLRGAPPGGAAASAGNGASAGAARRFAIRDVTLHVEQGSNLGIIGPNGAGKTTLLKIMLGLLEGYTGTISIFGMTPAQACRRGGVIGYVPQQHEAELRFPLSAGQVVRMGLVGKTGLFRRYGREDRRYADEIMDRAGVIDLRVKPISELSGGQRQRVYIARALVAKPRVLILDEPMSGIDEAGQQRFARLMHELHESLGLTVVIVSHDLQAVAAGCNRVACLRQTIHYHDAPQGLTPAVLGEVFQHDIAPALPR